MKDIIYVNITTWTKRIPSFCKTIHAINNQSLKADKIIVWLSADEFKSIPCEIQNLLDNKLISEVNFVEGNTYCHKRWECMRKHSDVYNIMIDDDIAYPFTYIENLYMLAKQHQDCVADYLTIQRDYIDCEEKDIEFTSKPSHKNFYLSGLSCFPPNIFPQEYFDFIKERDKYSPTSDDAWLKGFFISKDIKIVGLEKWKNFVPWTIDESQDVALWKNQNSGRQYGKRTRILQLGGCIGIVESLLGTSNINEIYPDFGIEKCMGAIGYSDTNCVDVYMASIWRGGFITDTLNSIINQPEVHSINVSLNNYTDEQAEQVMSQCTNKKIKWHRTNNEKCSNEKLRFVHEGTSRYIAFADDDLIYSPNHFAQLIGKCEAWGGGVSLHGGIFKQMPIKSYYSGRNVYRCLEDLSQDIEVDILGNGAGLFKREWLSKDEWKALYDDATDVSMDDILVGCAMNKKNIHLYVVAHAKMQHKERIVSDNYVAEKYCNNDSVQCEYINANYHRIFDPNENGIYTEREKHIIQRFQKQYPTCDVWIEGRYLCLRKKGTTGKITRYTL